MIKITFHDGSVRDYNEGVTDCKLQKVSVRVWRKTYWRAE